MKFLLAMSLVSICLVLVSARLIRRRETIEKLVEFKVAVPFLLKSWQQGCSPLGQPCDSLMDCCSLYCLFGKCSEPFAGVSRK